MIDWNRVSELRDEIGAEDFGEVVELFLDEVAVSVSQLEDCVGDAQRTEEQMHFLKGAALNLGFAALSSLTCKGEAAARSGDLAAVPAQDVSACFDQSRAVFITGFAERFAA